MAKQAEKRMLAGKAQNPPPNLGEGSNKHDGETLEVLARDIGIGRESLRKDNASYSSGRGFYARQQVRAL